MKAPARAWSAQRDGPWPFAETAGGFEAAEQEWLHTNGAGAYAMSTLALMHTRRYHGVLVASLEPPLGRYVVVSHAETNVTIEDDKRTYRLATHQFPELAPTPGYRLLQSFTQDPIPRWIFRLGKEELERTLCLVRGKNAVVVGYTWHGRSHARISVRPLLPMRPVDKLMVEHGAMNQEVILRGGSVVVHPVLGLPQITFGHEGVFMGSPDWWRRFEYLEDRSLGSDFQEDVWTPGVFELGLEPGRTTYLVISVGALPALLPRELMEQTRAALLAQDPGNQRPASVRMLSVAAEQFCVDDCPKPVIIAGYPWHAIHTRDQLLSIVGLQLVRGRLDLARRTLRTLLAEQRFGLLPEYLVAAGSPRAKPVPDTTLLLFEVARELHARFGAREPVLQNELYPALVRAFVRIRSRRRNWVWLSAEGLVACGKEGQAVTWMDAHVRGVPITPRHGLPVEIQALWSKGTETLAALAREYGHTRVADAAARASDTARAAFRARFWCHETDYPYDCLSEEGDMGDAWGDPSIRPNALIALAIDPALFETWQARAILDRVRAELLTQRGIRSLSPRDPQYVGQFLGSTLERELAYHQGTAWTHLLGFYVRAVLADAPGDPRVERELTRLVEDALEGSLLLGQLAQLADGDPPHRARGCPAQASSVAELLRALVADLGM